MLQAKYIPYIFNFNFPGGTSRGVLNQKPSWFIQLWDSHLPEIIGLGEVSIIPGLSPDAPSQIEPLLNGFCKAPEHFMQKHNLTAFPAIKFGIETALRDLQTGGNMKLYESDFTEGKSGIIINGLVWMGAVDTMLERINRKVNDGFKCIKIKVGALDFEKELELLKTIRSNFSDCEIEIRLDANGAFAPDNALSKLEKLAPFKIHSIEQPIKQGQGQAMKTVCKQSPIPVALDEELIGVTDKALQTDMLAEINPQYIILKPSLVGGLEAAEQWRLLADKHKIGWWVTSALEGNIGLNAIAQWTFLQASNLPQGLGTGTVFSNNIASPLEIKGQELWYKNAVEWQLKI